MTIYDRPWDLTQAVLAAVQAEFALAVVDTPDVALPARQFCTTGVVVYDAEQLSVTLIRMYGQSGDDGAETDEPTRCLAWRGAEFEILLLRCAPQIDVLISGEVRAPSAEAYSSFGELVAGDAMRVTRGLLRAYRAETFGVGPVMSLGKWESVGEGDLGGGALRVRIMLA